MSNKSAAHPPSRNHTAFSRKTIIVVGLGMIAVFFLTVVVYPMIFNSNTNDSSTVIDQPVMPAPVIK